MKIAMVRGMHVDKDTRKHLIKDIRERRGKEIVNNVGNAIMKKMTLVA